jgi:hypothetical protein
VSNPVTIQQIQLPYQYTGDDGNPFLLLGWINSTQVKIRGLDENAPEIKLSSLDTLQLLQSLGFSPENVPGQKKRSKATKVVAEETVSRKEWEMFLRFKERIAELREASSDIRVGWRDHIRYLQEEYSDYNKQYDEMQSPIRSLPRILSYITSGVDPADDEDEEEHQRYYDDDLITTQWGNVNNGYKSPRGRQVVTVKIEDISTGDL